MDYEPLRIKILLRCILNKKSGCEIWQGAKDAHGFGRMNTPEGVRSIHRIVYLAKLQRESKTLEDGMLVYHRCGNRACANEEHLYEAPLQEPRPLRSMHFPIRPNAKS